jgi:hypothetical protein
MLRTASSKDALHHMLAFKRSVLVSFFQEECALIAQQWMHSDARTAPSQDAVQLPVRAVSISADKAT